MKKMNQFAGLAAVVMFYLAGMPRARAADETVWQIGEFDHATLEFTKHMPYSPGFTPPDPVYRVGESDWKKDWPAFHPGSANGVAGGREHPYAVIFPLPTAPRGVYTLTVATLHFMPRQPNLRVEINGKQGMFYLRPVLSYDRRDHPVDFMPQYSFQELKIDVPADYFRQGENRLTLTAIDDPAEAESSSGSGGPGISGFHYDAIRLSQDATKKFSPGEIQATVTPTVFYKAKEGGLVELVEAIVRLNQKASAGRGILTINGKSYSAGFPAADFGEQRLEFEVPEWSGPVQGRLRVAAKSARSFDVMLEPARKWTVFVVSHTHLDVGYTDYQGKVMEGQPRVLSQAVGFLKQNPNFRFTLDGSWEIEYFFASRAKAKQDELLDLIRQDKLALPAQYCSLLTGYASLETLFRSLYYSKSLARQYGLPFEFANITDVPSYTWSYPSILASAGIKYFAAGGNNTRATFLIRGRWNEKSPLWWEGPDGKKILFWYSHHYMQVQTLLGLPPSQTAVRDSLPIFLQAYSHPGYKPDATMIYGTQVENTDLVPGTATFADAWNRTYSYPRLTYATMGDFFKYIDTHYGTQLETYRGDGGPYWEDGIGSDAYFAAEDRCNQNRALSAETLSTVTHLLDPSLHAPKELLDDIWRNIVLFAEHTWGAWNSISMPDHEETVKQLEVKDHFATMARLEIDQLTERSMSQLAEQLHVPSNTIVVFNSLNWRRDSLVETDLFENAELKDLSSGRAVPFEVLGKKPGFVHVRFLAEDLPPVGYKCYAISYPPQPSSAPAPQETTREAVVENRFYRVTLDAASGAVASIYDKELGREIVDTRSPYKFNQYLYVTGGDGQTRILHPTPLWPVPDLKVQPSSAGEITEVSKTAYGQAIRLRSSATNTPSIRTEILLFDKEKKIEFINRVDKKPELAKEAVYFAFPVAVQPPEFIYATQTGWVNPAQDLLAGAGLEWFNVQYWMAARDNQLAVAVVPLDASLAAFGDIFRGLWPTDFRPKTSTLFSYVMNNYWDTNYRAAQGGEGVFRYVVTSGPAFEPQALSRLAWSHLKPVEINQVVGQDKVGNPPRPLPPEGASFLEIDQPNIVLLTWKRAEDAQGTILRLYETGGRDTEASLRFLRTPVHTAHLANGVEDNLSALGIDGSSFRVSFHPHEVVTLRVE